MVYRDRQGLSPGGDPVQSSANRDHYLDNCFLLCINRHDGMDVPEIRRLENNLIQDLCNTNPLNKSKSQQQSRRNPPDQRRYRSDNEEWDPYDGDGLAARSQRDEENYYQRKEKQPDYYPEAQTVRNRSRFAPDGTTHSYQTRDRPDQYSRAARFNRRDDHNLVQHSDDELSVYEVYVPTNTLNRLSDKRAENNLVLIDYEDASMMRATRDTASPYGHPSQYARSAPPQFNGYKPSNPYQNPAAPQYPYDPAAAPGYPDDRQGPQPFYQNNPVSQQQGFGGYYPPEGDPRLYSPQQSGPFVPASRPVDPNHGINVRRHLYSPSQLPQGLTEGQLVMLLQKGAQYQQSASSAPAPGTQLVPPLQEPQPSTTTTAVSVSHQASPAPSAYGESLQSPVHIPTAQIKLPPVPPQIVDHRLQDEDKTSLVDEITKPMSTLNTAYTMKPSKDVESKESDEKKKDKTSDAKKDKKSEKDASSNKKDGKKEKSSGKDAKKKKKK